MSKRWPNCIMIILILYRNTKRISEFCDHKLGVRAATARERRERERDKERESEQKTMNKRAERDSAYKE